MAGWRTPIETRFWAKVERSGLDDCWQWCGHRNHRGYGIIYEGGTNGRDLLAHRVSWELANGEPLGQRHALHRCDNPSCVNPAHLVAGTHSDNMRDMHSKKRHPNSSRTVCIRGHELTSENVYRYGNRRHCRSCHRIRAAARKAAA